MDKVIAVTGATGYVGRFVVDELGRNGMRIRALARRESNRSGFDVPVEWVEGDLRSEAAVARLLDGAAGVVHLAYEHIPGRYRGGEGDDLPGWLDANLNGSLRLVEASQKAGVERFVFLSSRAVFSRTLLGRELDEMHPLSPDTHYGAYKAAVEAFLYSFSTSGMKTCALRATGIYGLTYPLERSKWWGLVRAVMHDEPVTDSGGGTEVHGADVARVMRAALERDDMPAADIIHLSDLYLSQREVVRLARQFAGKPGILPPEPAQRPNNMLVCRRIEAMGIQLGGIRRLENTVEALVKAVLRQSG